MGILKNLKIGQKLALVVVVMGIPIAVLVYLFIDARNVQIEAAQQEVEGVHYLSPMRRLLEHIPMHRVAADGLLRGDVAARDAMLEAQTSVDADIMAVNNADSGATEKFNVTLQWEQFRSDWRQLKEDVFELSAEESFQRHLSLTAGVTALIRDVADQSNLALDPGRDSHFLMDAVVTILPGMTEDLSVMEALGVGVIDRTSSITDAAQVEGVLETPGMNIRQSLNRLTGHMEDELRTLKIGAEAAFDANPGLETRISPDLSSAESAIQTFLDANFRGIVQPLATGSGRAPTRISEADYRAAAQEANAALLALYDSSMTNLQATLQGRIDTLTQEKYFQLSATVFILAFTIILVLFLNRTVTEQISEINGLFSRISVGDLEARAAVRSDDELGRMTSSLNQMLDNTLSLVQSKDERDRIQISIEKLLEEIAGVAEGDLTKEAEVTAEVTGAITDSFNYMIGELRSIISQVQQTTLQVSAAANEVQHTAESLAEGSELQSMQILDTSSAVEDMAKSTHQVSQNAAAAAEVAKAALQNALDGADAVSKTIAGMHSIRNQVQETSKRIKRLGESSQEIGEITQLISDIADRTSILALNASIQASMAGESGRGFAVVAEEVEGLAERATDATKRIETLIKAIQQDMNEAVGAMEDTTQEVVGGSHLANEAGQKLEQIESVSQQLAELIQSISAASEVQAGGSKTVAGTMGDIAGVTQQNADGARGAATSIRDLASLADELRNSVSRFKIPTRSHANMA